MQAKWLGQSEFNTHSGRQLGGLPTKPVRHEQEGVPSAETRHWELGPQGFGWQGSFGASCKGGSRSARERKKKK